jgi:hypothetical protein
MDNNRDINHSSDITHDVSAIDTDYPLIAKWIKDSKVGVPARAQMPESIFSLQRWVRNGRFFTIIWHIADDKPIGYSLSEIIGGIDSGTVLRHIDRYLIPEYRATEEAIWKKYVIAAHDHIFFNRQAKEGRPNITRLILDMKIGWGDEANVRSIFEPLGFVYETMLPDGMHRVYMGPEEWLAQKAKMNIQ